MSTPLISCFLLSHNKGPYAVQAVQSVLNQSFPGWECWVLENSTDTTTRRLLKKRVPELLTDPRFHYEEIEVPDDVRGSKYVPCWLHNLYYPKAGGEWVCLLSDDDLFTEDCFEVCADAIRGHPAWDAVWFGLRGIRAPTHEVIKGTPVQVINADVEKGKGTRNFQIDNHVDGGQVMHRRTCLDKMERPWWPEDKSPSNARHSDGTYLVKLAREFTLHPLYRVLLVHRFTPVSLWTKC